jgi:beta-glucosidase/6-phospho-beta-glucosidase/beta-galactosidase
MTPAFMFATGIENSIPTIAGGVRVDEMAKCGFYARWREDFALVHDLGLRFLRFGPPLHTSWRAEGHYDWDFADATFGELRRLRIIPIVDLCHFGVPDWLGNFQNPDFPRLFARYAGAFAERFPWVQLYTPVNEMFITAQFSARYGWWNERLKSDRGFVTALKHVVKANVLAMETILAHRPDALFIQSESSEYFHAVSPAAIAPAEMLNQQRFLSLDLNYGRRVDSGMYEFLLDNGMTRDEYHFFLGRRPAPLCVMGSDYYVTNEHLVEAERPDPLRRRHLRLRRDHPAVSRPLPDPGDAHRDQPGRGPHGDEAVMWLRKQWANALRIRNAGIPMLGFTWYSLTDQVDWDTALREENGHVNALGLYDLDRRERAVGANTAS